MSIDKSCNHFFNNRYSQTAPVRSIALLISMIAIPLFSQELTQSDFAHGVTIERSASSSELTFDLPLHYYENSVSSRGIDCRIFNEMGHELPFSIVNSDQRTQVSQSEVKQLPFFPMTPNSRVTRQSMSRVTTTTNNRSAETSVVVVERSNGVVQDTPISYIVHNESNSTPITQLRFGWKQFEQSRIIPIKIEGSNDLQRWSTISSRETLSRLIFMDEKIEESSVRTSRISHRYLRITPDQSEGAIEFTSIEGTYNSSSTREIERQWLTLDAGEQEIVEENDKIDTVDGSYLFTTNGFIPYDQIKFRAPISGVVYKGQLSHRQDSSQSWSYSRQFSQYEILSSGDTLRSSPHSASSSSPELRLKFSSPKKMDATLLPELSIRLVPQRVEFLARGEGPFTFVYGNDTLSTKTESYRVMNRCERVEISEPFSLGGGEIPEEERNKEIKVPTSTKTIVLWSVLILGVLLVVSMAISLSKELKAGKGSDDE